MTKSGTLGLNWNVAPTSFDTPNAIVKRDESGNITAASIRADQGISGESASGIAAYGASETDIGVYGSSGSDIGVLGTGATGVYGTGTTGVYGTGTTGVFGTGSDKGFYTDSNVGQARTANGWVKAMAYVNASVSPYSIVECFNSTLVGAAATTPPCGMDLEEISIGFFSLNFDFQINDRFFSATLGGTTLATMIQVQPQSTTQLTIATLNADVQAMGANYWLMVY